MKIKKKKEKDICFLLVVAGLAVKACTVTVLPCKAVAKSPELFGCFANKVSVARVLQHLLR